MKKILALLLTLLLMLTVLVACDTNDTPNGDTPLPSPGGGNEDGSLLPEDKGDNSAPDIDWDLV